MNLHCNVLYTEMHTRLTFFIYDSEVMLIIHAHERMFTLKKLSDHPKL